jgi:hypothetical protein
LDGAADQRILIVGDGNLSFALALCKGLGTGDLVTATTYDTRAELAKYPETAAIIAALTQLGSKTLHGVDAMDLKTTLVDSSGGGPAVGGGEGGTGVGAEGAVEEDVGDGDGEGAAGTTHALPPSSPLKLKYDRIVFQFPLAHPPATREAFEVRCSLSDEFLPSLIRLAPTIARVDTNMPVI